MSIFEHGGHFGHVTWIIYTNFCSLFLRRLHIIVGFDWPSNFRGEDVWKWLTTTTTTTTTTTDAGAWVYYKLTCEPLALIGQVVSEKMFENGWRQRQRRRRTPEHGYTISSPVSLWLRWAKKANKRWFGQKCKTSSSHYHGARKRYKRCKTTNILLSKKANDRKR